MKEKVTIKDIEKLLFQASAKFVSKPEAEYFAKEQIECALRMYPDVNTISEAINDLNVWQTNKKATIEILTDKNSILLINFNGLGPSLKLKYIHDELEKKAKNNGIALFGLNNSYVTDWLKLWTYGLAKRNLIAIYAFNGGPGSAVPYGGTIPIFGTNPISYAIPTENDPILVDMATSELAFYKYNKARKNKIHMKENSFADEHGNPTNDPEMAYIDDESARILPMGGGYKGYNIIFLVEVLTGALVRSKMGLQKSHAYSRLEYGGILVAIDISSLTDVIEFKKSVSKMCMDIRNQKHGDHVNKVVVPGDISKERAEKIKAAGFIEIDNDEIKKLRELAGI